MAYIVKDVSIDNWTEFVTNKSISTVTVKLECTHGQASDLLKGVANDNFVFITVPYGNGDVAGIIGRVKAKIADQQKHRREEMEIHNAIYGAKLEVD